MNRSDSRLEECHRELLGLICVAAFALRLAGIDWGVPSASHTDYSYHPDEAFHILWARWLVDGQIIPKHFMYGGTLHYSMLNAYYYYGRLLGGWLGGINDLANTIIVGRLFVAVFSVATIALVGEIGRRLDGARLGLLAATILAVSPAHIFLAKSVRPDEFGTLIATLIAYLSVVILQANATMDRRWFVLSGLAVGFGVALRAPLLVFVVGPVAAWLLRERPRTIAQLLQAGTTERAVAILAGIMVGYAVASPHTFFYFSAVKAGVAVQYGYQSGVFEDAIARGARLYQYGFLMLHEALGMPLYLLAMAGVVWAAIRRTSATMLLLALILPYFIILTITSWVVVRYALPLVPILSLLAAIFVVELWRAGGKNGWLLTAGCLAAVGWTIASDLAFLRAFAFGDVRDECAQWIGENLPQGSGLVLFEQYNGDVFFNPPVPAGFSTAIYRINSGLSPHLLERDVSKEYLVINETIYENMDRLGELHPREEIRTLSQILNGGEFTLMKHFKRPAVMMGVDFSSSFFSQDFDIINPGIRVYQRTGVQ